MMLGGVVVERGWMQKSVVLAGGSVRLGSQIRSVGHRAMSTRPTPTTTSRRRHTTSLTLRPLGTTNVHMDIGWSAAARSTTPAAMDSGRADQRRQSARFPLAAARHPSGSGGDLRRSALPPAALPTAALKSDGCISAVEVASAVAIRVSLLPLPLRCRRSVSPRIGLCCCCRHPSGRAHVGSTPLHSNSMIDWHAIS